MNIRTRTTAVLVGGTILTGSLFAATAADAGSPIPSPLASNATYQAALAAVQAAAANASSPVSTSSASGYGYTWSPSSSSSSRSAAPTLTASALALVSEIDSGISTPCAFDASEAGSLIVFGNYPGETYVVQYSVHGVPVELKTGKLGSRGTSLKAVPSGWNDSNVRVWAGGTRCSLT